MTTLAKYLFSTLAMNAKVHSLLESMNSGKEEASASSFEETVAGTVDELSSENVLTEVKEEFHALEALYRDMKERSLPENVVSRFDTLFASIKEKISEKESV